MPNTTGRWPIAYPAPGAALIPWQDHFQDTAQSVSDALDGAKTPFAVANAADRLAKFPSPVDGDRVWRIDFNREEYYDGSNWVSNQSGLILIEPGSAYGGATIASDGAVEFSSVSGFAGALGVFSSRFRSYKVRFSLSGGSGSMQARLTAAGVPISTAGAYSWTREFLNASATTVASSASDSVLTLSGVSSASYQGEFDIFDPANAAIATALVMNGVAGGLRSDAAARRIAATAEDGIVIATGVGSFSGWMKVYGCA